MKTKNILTLVLRCIAVGAGVAVLALLSMEKVDTEASLWLLALGLACLAVSSISEQPQQKDKK